MIEFKDVVKEYPNKTRALDGVSLKIEDGEFVFIIGPSGSGKSTMVKLMMKEEDATGGKVLVNGYDLTAMKEREVPYFRRTLGVVFQDFRLISNMNVYNNVAFAMRAIGASSSSIRKRVPYILKIVGLYSKAKAYPSEISGGEQQRVALARALVNNPSILIADEPTGNIDPKMSLEIMGLLNEINKLKTTVIVVTHDHSLVQRFRKRVIYLEKGKVVRDTRGGAYGG